MSDFKHRLREVIESDHEELVALGEQVIADESGLSATYTRDEIDQLVRAFEQVLLEQLEGGDGSIRRFVIDSAIPALVAQGESLGGIVGTLSSWTVVLSSHFLDRLGEEHRLETTRWLASFLGTYGCEVAETAQEATG